MFARHGFDELIGRTGLGALLPGRPRPSQAPQMSRAVRLRAVIEELGPSFIKLGQIASTRPDLIPADIIAELRGLQDDVAPVPFDEIREQIQQQLGAPIAAIFADFDERPLASASIGQVYRAKLRMPQEGGDALEDVVVKVQRPGISATIERDVDLLYWLAHAIERSIPEAKIYKPVRLVDEFDRTVRAELDYGQEADNAERFRDNFEGAAGVRFPCVFRQASARRVLTLEYLPGVNVFAAVEAGASGEDIARTAIDVIIKMVFDHGFFHADPHPGNLLIMGPPDAPVLGIIDLGQVGRLSPRARDRMIDLLVAIGRKDSRAIASALLHLGTPTKRLDRDAFEAEVASLTDRYLGRRLADIEPAVLLRELVQGSQRFGLEMPAELMVVAKCLMTVEGIGRQIYPELDLADALTPYLKEMVSLRYSPERLTNDLVNLAMTMTQVAGDFPARIEQILEDVRQGRVSIEARQPQLQRSHDRLGRRIASGVVSAGLIVSGAGLLAVNKTVLGGVLWGLAVGLTLWTFLALVSTGRRE
ncbi:MAG: AarF/ABC1/UbiB kinase family protein [Myxococcales bacterium]|nr:AarF/ABC1/UbiB kinase family protein [Myxococcales bacterium]MDD9972042.1 AarF/ABC1/UbiB kinase family protein [Myxococcales bacterium]